MLMRAAASHLLIVDVQEKLLPKMSDLAALCANLGRLIAAARQLDVPLTVSEQYPAGLGPTIPEIAERIEDGERFEKISFSCFRDPTLAARLHPASQLVIAGIEAHVCVLQSALEAIDRGIDVFIVADAVSSRTLENRSLALKRLRQAGARIVSTEMVLFEWVEKAGTELFREISRLVR